MKCFPIKEQSMQVYYPKFLKTVTWGISCGAQCPVDSSSVCFDTGGCCPGTSGHMLRALGSFYVDRMAKEDGMMGESPTRWSCCYYGSVQPFSYRFIAGFLGDFRQMPCGLCLRPPLWSTGAEISVLQVGRAQIPVFFYLVMLGVCLWWPTEEQTVSGGMVDLPALHLPAPTADCCCAVQQEGRRWKPE